MIGKVIFPFAVFNVQFCSAFRCYSEYEFNWWDSRGVEHVYGFSMSHFQLKMRSLLVEHETNRVPFKESFFLARLHPSYQTNLKEECPHAMIQANFLVSLFHSESGNLTLALDFYSKALSIFNHAPLVHQQVSLLAWPFESLKKEVEIRLQPRLMHVPSASLTVVLVVTKSSPIDTVLFDLVLDRFQSHTIVLLSQMDEFPETKIVHYRRHSESICFMYISLLLKVPPNEALMFLDLRHFFSYSLVHVFMQYILNGGRSSMFYSFSQDRILKFKNLPSGYSGLSFGVLGDFTGLSFSVCESTDPWIESNMWGSVLRPGATPRRCDDEKLPWSLRLCRGDEPFKTDWHDVLLAPVLPRFPVANP